MSFLEFNFIMPNFAVDACMEGYEEAGKDCGGECWTETCTLAVRPVRLTQLNAIALHLHRRVQAVGWDGLEALGFDMELTELHRNHVAWVIETMKIYDSILSMPDKEQAKHMTEFLNDG